MTSYIEARIAKKQDLKSKQIELIVRAIHDYHSKKDEYCLGLSFPENIDFSNQEDVTRIGIVGDKEALKELLDSELADFEDDYMIAFSEPKLMPDDTKKIILKHKAGLGLKGNIPLLKNRAADHVQYVKEKYGEDVSYEETQIKMFKKAIELDSSVPYLPISAYSVSAKRFFTMKVVQGAVKGNNAKRTEGRKYNIYGMRSPVAMLPV